MIIARLRRFSMKKSEKNINCTWNYSSNNFNIAINIESVMGLIP